MRPPCTPYTLLFMLPIILHGYCICDFDHMFHSFAVWHDDPSLSEVGMLVEGFFSCAPWKSLVGRISILLGWMVVVLATCVVDCFGT
jgi:hypothetical protein